LFVAPSGIKQKIPTFSGFIIKERWKEMPKKTTYSQVVKGYDYLEVSAFMLDIEGDYNEAE